MLTVPSLAAALLRELTDAHVPLTDPDSGRRGVHDRFGQRT